MIDFDKLPSWWPVCHIPDCPMASACLHRMVAEQLPEKVKVWPCILPGTLKDGKCQFFQKIEVVRMARGFRAIYDKVHGRDARHNFRMDLTHYYGSKGAYYRYRDGERMISPADQQMILNLSKEYGVQEASFDEYIEGYDFTQYPI